MPHVFIGAVRESQIFVLVTDSDFEFKIDAEDPVDGCGNIVALFLELVMDR